MRRNTRVGAVGALDPRETEEIDSCDALRILQREFPCYGRGTAFDTDTDTAKNLEISHNFIKFHLMPIIELPLWSEGVDMPARMERKNEITKLCAEIKKRCNLSDKELKEKEDRVKQLKKERTKAMNTERFNIRNCEQTVKTYNMKVERCINEAVLNDSLSHQDAQKIVEVCLRIFIAENFTGQLCAAEIDFFRPILERFSFEDEAEDAFVVKMLTTDGETPHSSIQLGSLMLLCTAIVRSNITSNGIIVPFFPNNDMWKLRVLFCHQMCISHRSHTLFCQIADCVDTILQDTVLSTDPRCLLEVGHVQNYFHKRDLAGDTFRKAIRCSGLVFAEESFMGVRTKYQTKQVAQSVLRATSVSNPSYYTANSFLLSRFPVQYPLFVSSSVDSEMREKDDDLAVKYILPRVVGSEKESTTDTYDYPRNSMDGDVIHDGTAQPLTPLNMVDRALIIAMCLNVNNANPHHGLVHHRIQCYLERLVADPSAVNATSSLDGKNFILESVLLLLRARLERDRPRLAQRSFLQVQELIDQFSVVARDHKRPTFHRTNPDHFFLVAFPSIWELRREFGNFCFEDNLFKTALDLFEQIHDWELIIKCCKKLDKRRRAENLAKELIEEDPGNPMFWVALGDATREVKHFEYAWELSEHKMAAPMRSLAKLYLEREQFEKVVECFDKAVAINPIFGGDWFSLGFASLKLKNLERGTAAFTRVCQIDPNDAYAWNNLGSLLLQQGKTRAAFNAISQALRNNRRSWRMWINYYAIGAELQEVIEAAQALVISLDIGGREVKLDPTSLYKFTEGCVDYLKGKIHGTKNPHISDGLSEEEIPDHARHVESDEDDLTVDITPFGGELEIPDEFFPKTQLKDIEEAESQRKISAKRFEMRLKEIFQKCTDLFTNNEDLYACIATLYRYTDGPIAAFKYREKEHRVTSQVDQWARDDSKFKRLVLSLTSMAGDAVAALDTLSNNGDADEQIETRTKEAVDAIQKTKCHIDAALQVSAEHMEDSKEYRELQVLKMSLLKIINKY